MKLANEALSKHKNFRWCTCGKGQIHGPGSKFSLLAGLPNINSRPSRNKTGVEMCGVQETTLLYMPRRD
jgi:hypothetical protein